MHGARRAAKGLRRIALAAVVALSCLAIWRPREREPDSVTVVAGPAMRTPVASVSVPTPPAVDARRDESGARPGLPPQIENGIPSCKWFEVLGCGWGFFPEHLDPQVAARHVRASQALARSREDAVDDCRDRVRLPGVDKLLPWSTVYRPPGHGFLPPAREISMEQNILFDISTSIDAYEITSAKVVETWLWFPGNDGSLLRAPFFDASLDRCVERALTGAAVDSTGVVPGERFRMYGRAGEAVYDFR